jgi:hypothetical protein
VEADLLLIEQLLGIETQNFLVLPLEFGPESPQRIDDEFLRPVVI